MVYKNIYLFFLTVFSGVSLLGYDRVNIKNGTPYEVHVWVTYVGCNGDNWTVQPHSEQSAPTSRGACLAKRIDGYVDEELTEGKFVKKNFATYPADKGQGMGVNWQIAGPLWDSNKNSYYTIE